MNIPATLTKCRAELKRQQEMEAKMTTRWHQLESDVYEIRNCLGLTLATFDMQHDAVGVCLSRNLNPARLRVAEDKLASAESCWEVWTDLLEYQVHEESELQFTEERRLDMFVFEGGKSDLLVAATLLGVEVVE